MSLESELATYRRELPTLLKAQEGQFVLIKGDHIIGVFPSHDDALSEGFQRFGHQPFLAKQIQTHEEPVPMRDGIFR